MFRRLVPLEHCSAQSPGIILARFVCSEAFFSRSEVSNFFVQLSASFISSFWHSIYRADQEITPLPHSPCPQCHEPYFQSEQEVPYYVMICFLLFKTSKLNTVWLAIFEYFYFLRLSQEFVQVQENSLRLDVPSSAPLSHRKPQGLKAWNDHSSASFSISPVLFIFISRGRFLFNFSNCLLTISVIFQHLKLFYSSVTPNLLWGRILVFEVWLFASFRPWLYFTVRFDYLFCSFVAFSNF